VKLSITIPAYNEEATLEEIVEEALSAGAAMNDDFEVLIVNDGSSDETGRLADRLAAARPNVRVVHHEHNRGFSGAMRSCVDEAMGEYVFLGPADGQAEFDEIRRFWAMKEQYDLVFSCRAGRDDSAGRKVSSAVWYAFLRILFGRVIPEFSSTFLFRRAAIPEFAVKIRPDASNFLPVLYLTAIETGRSVGTLRTVQHQRRGGVAKGGSVTNSIRTVIEDIVLWWRLRVRPGR
jgi:glycosyltransferase involved in cell wall biosynthesis